MRRIAFLGQDLMNIAFATLFALYLRNDLALPPDKLIALVPYLAATLVLAAIIFPTFGIDRSIWRFSGLGDYLAVALACLAIVIGAVAFSFVYNRMEGIARSIPLLQGIVMVWVLIGVRVGMRLVATRAEQRARPATSPVIEAKNANETILVVGIGRLAELYVRCVADMDPKRRWIAGILSDSKELTERHAYGRSVLGSPEQVAEIIRDLEIHGVFVDRIVVAMDFKALSDDAQSALLGLETSSTIRLDFLQERLGLGADSDEAQQNQACDTGATDAAAGAYQAQRIAQLGAMPYWRVKRLIDALVALTLIVLLAPVMALVGLLVAIDIGLPVIFWQQRPGLRARPFKLYKFRTMRAAHDAAGLRVPDDMRHSALGAWLRRTRLDELPQLFLILTGSMSFIGPRPLLPADQASGFEDRLLVRPGLTGWAQVQGGRDVTPRDKAALDLWYVRNACLSLDLQILWRTVPMVLFGERIDQAAIRQAWDEHEGHVGAEAP